MALPVAGCDLRESAQEQPGGQCDRYNRLRGYLTANCRAGQHPRGRRCYSDDTGAYSHSTC